MRAIGLDFDSRTLTERQLPEPREPLPDEVLFRVHEVGVCGTDRDLAHFRLGRPPEGQSFLTLGHEALGQVVACGSSVRGMRPGDWLVPTVRRPCIPACSSCARDRADLCVEGRYTERGILGLHGYFAEYAVDAERDVVPVPGALAEVAVLLEPLSVVEKAVESALRIHEPGARTAIVLGAGTVGILAALVLELRGLHTSIHSIEPADGARARLVRDAGIAYGGIGKADLIIEATGSADAILEGITMMAPLGVMIVLGAIETFGAVSFTRMVVENQTIAGSVNASPQAWRDAIADLARIDRTLLKRLIRRVPGASYRESILGPNQQWPEPKTVHVLNKS